MSEDTKIEIGLQSIHEIAFKLNKEFDFAKVDKDHLFISINRHFSSNIEEETFDIDLKLSYTYNQNTINIDTADNVQLLFLEVKNRFQIKELNSILEIKDDSYHFKKDILPELLRISIGAIRGILFSRTRETPLSEYPLPLMNTENILGK
jgi:hypothetical protein